MNLSTLLIAAGIVLAFLDIVLHWAPVAYNRVLLTPLGVVFGFIGVLIMTGGIHT